MVASLLHEALVELFQRNPRLAPLVAAAGGLALPAYDEVHLHPGELTELVPVGYRADAVVLLTTRGKARHALLVEVQLGDDGDKRFSWPLYQAATRARHRCPATLCVLALEPDVGRWCAEPIDTGQPDSPFVPLVLGAGAVPLVRDPTADPHLATLSALAHGNEPGGHEVVLAALGAAERLGGDEGAMLQQIIWASLGEAARRALEAMMDYEKVKAISPFYREGLERGQREGKAEGLREGEARGKAAALVAVLAARGLEVDGETRARIEGCVDVARLDRWLARALRAASAREALDDDAPAPDDAPA
ncbi:MAG TPA: hypothetical protein VFS43_26805 [Polyangiaceae bacterium]|nr:hypothetical protein [Polyangiaceae bacterium]